MILENQQGGNSIVHCEEEFVVSIASGRLVKMSFPHPEHEPLQERWNCYLSAGSPCRLLQVMCFSRHMKEVELQSGSQRHDKLLQTITRIERIANGEPEHPTKGFFGFPKENESTSI